MSRALVPIGRAGGRYEGFDSDSEQDFELSEDEERMGPSPGTRPDGLEGTVATVSEFFSSLFILVFMVMIYLWGAVELCRKHIWMEALFTVVLPVFAIRMGWQTHTLPFQQRLIYLDTMFNAFAVIAKISIVSDIAWLNAVTNYASIIFLLMQFGWYVAFCITEGLTEERTLEKALAGMHWFTAAMAAAMFVSLVVERAEAGHFFFGAQNTLGPEGELLFWGQDAGVMIKLNYVCWQTYVLFCDDFKTKVSNEGVEGYMMVPVAQFCSVIVAWLSGEFWHARMITGVHLVLMDGIHHTHNMSYRDQAHHKSHGEFCVMPAHWYKEWDLLSPGEKHAALGYAVPLEHLDDHENRTQPCCTKILVPLLKWILLTITLLSPAAAVACGSTEFFCGMHIEAHHLWT